MTTVELRPMSLGELLDRTFTVYRNHFWLFAGIMAVPYLVILAINVLSSSLQATGPRAAGAHPPSVGAVLAVGGLVFILVMVVTFAMYAAAQAATIFAVSDVYLGKSTSVRQSYRHVRGRVGRVFALIIMVGLAMMGGFVLFIVPGIIVLCRTAVAIPAAMLENISARQALNRSVSLTKGFAMKVFVVFILVLILTWVAAAIFQFPILIAVGSMTAKRHTLPFGLAVLSHLSSFVSGVLVGPIAMIAYSLIYYDLRVRKEAFDLQFMMASLSEPGAAAGSEGARTPA